MWRVNIATIFPQLFPGPLGISCIGRKHNDSWSLTINDLKQFSVNGRIDDEPFGGGGGMIFKPDVIDQWIIESNLQNVRKIYMSPRGKVLKQDMIEDFVKQDICVLCGRYEGVDNRVLEHWNFEEISVGDFILHGGEVAAMAFVEACARFLSIKPHSLNNDSLKNCLLEANNYTRPKKWLPKDSKIVYNVPEVLISGHHAKIKEWRKKSGEALTKERRPDLYDQYKNLYVNREDNE